MKRNQLLVASIFEALLCISETNAGPLVPNLITNNPNSIPRSEFFKSRLSGFPFAGAPIYLRDTVSSSQPPPEARPQNATDEYQVEDFIKLFENQTPTEARSQNATDEYQVEDFIKLFENQTPTEARLQNRGYEDLNFLSEYNLEELRVLKLDNNSLTSLNFPDMPHLLVLQLVNNPLSANALRDTNWNAMPNLSIVYLPNEIEVETREEIEGLIHRFCHNAEVFWRFWNR